MMSDASAKYSSPGITSRFRLCVAAGLLKGILLPCKDDLRLIMIPRSFSFGEGMPEDCEGGNRPGEPWPGDARTPLRTKGELLVNPSGS